MEPFKVGDTPGMTKRPWRECHAPGALVFW